MNDERTFELLSAAADDDLSTEEKAELDELMGHSAEARRLKAEFEEMEHVLREAPELEPPPDLREQILRRVPQQPRTAFSLADRLGELRFGAVLRYGFSAAFGALLAVAIYESQPQFGSASDITELVGTMAPDTDSNKRRVLDSFSFRDKGISSFARLEQRDRALLVDVRIDTTRVVDIKFDFSAAGYEFEALAQTLSNLESIQFSNKVLKVKGRGQRRFAVLLRSPDDDVLADEAQIHLEYSSNGKLLRQGMLSADRQNSSDE